MRRPGVLNLTVCPIAVCYLVVIAGVLPGQTPDLSGRREPVPLSIGSPAGARVYKPGRWAPVGVEIANPTDQPQFVAATFYFPLVPDFQFVRRLYVPAHARRLATCLVQTPVLESRDVNAQQQFRKTFDLHAIVTLEDGSDRVLPGMTGELTRNSFLVKHLEHLSSAMFPETEPMYDSAFARPYDAAVAMRLAAGLSRRIGEFQLPVLPASVQDLDALDHLIVHNRVPFQDAATVEAIRAWLMRGGRLWIMLDRVDPSDVQWLLGDRLTPQVVDRTELTHFQLVSTSEPPTVDTQEHERPVDFMRVLVDGADVLYTVDGWPAAFLQKYGMGRVLFTTLGAAGWVRRARPREINPLDPDRQAVFLARAPLSDVAGKFFAPIERLPWESQGWKPYLEEHIGYDIVPSRTVCVILASYVIGLAGLGALGCKLRRASLLAWGGPLWMVAWSVPLVVLAWWRQRDVPRTLVESQHVVLSNDSALAYIHSSSALFQDAPTEVHPASERMGPWLPEPHGLEGTLRRLVFEDFHRWRWESLRVPMGIRLAHQEQTTLLPDRFQVTATFGPKGVEGRIVGLPVPEIEDPILLLPDVEALALHIESQGKFWAGPADALAPGRYVAGSWMTDERRRRQSLMSAARRQRVHTGFPRQPTLVFWGTPLSTQVQYATGWEPQRRLGTALYLCPVHFERPPAKTHAVIPSPFLTLVPVAGPTGRGVAASYDVQRREWLRMNVDSDTWLRVQLPKLLLPAVVTRVHLETQIEAPMRPVEIYLRGGKGPEPVDQFENTASVRRYDFTDQRLLELDKDGGLWIGLHVGEPKDKTGNIPEWQVQRWELFVEVDVY